MVSLSPKLKVLIAVAVVVIVGIIVAVVTVVVMQKNNVAKIRSLSFVDATRTMYVGEDATLDIVIDPANSVNKQVSFSSNNSSVLQIVSIDNSSVVVRALSIGTATVTVQSTANKKLIDVCTITVSDNIASGIECEDMSVIVGQEKSNPVTLLPSNANANKLIVSSYDKAHLSYARIDNVNGSVQLTVKAKTVGVSQVVLGIMAQTQNGDRIVLTTSVVVTSVNPTIEGMFYKVHSKSYTTNVNSEVIEDKFIIDGYNYELYFSFFEDSEYKTGANLDAVSIVYDSSLVSVQSATDSYQGNVACIKISPIAGSSWDSTVVKFSYAGKERSVRLYLMPERTSISVVAPSSMTVGQSYEIQLDNTTKMLVDAGFVSLAVINNNAAVDIDGYLLTAKSEYSGNVSIVRSFANGSYWDNAMFNSINHQCDLAVSISGIEFED